MEHKLKFPHRFSRSGALSALGFLLALAALLAYPETVPSWWPKALSTA